MPRELYDPDAAHYGDEQAAPGQRYCHRDPFQKGSRILSNAVYIAPQTVLFVREFHNASYQYVTATEKPRQDAPLWELPLYLLLNDWTAILTMGQYGITHLTVRGRTIEEAHDNALLHGRFWAYKDAPEVEVVAIIPNKVPIFT